jgi:hypothetical protein
LRQARLDQLDLVASGNRLPGQSVPTSAQIASNHATAASAICGGSASTTS